MSRKKYVNAYETVYDYDEKGRETRTIHYRGDYFELNLKQDALRRYKITQLILFFIIFAIQVALGFMDHPGSRILYVSVPYVIAFIPLMYWLLGALRLPIKEQEFRLEVIGLSFERVKLMSLLTAIASGVSALGMVVFLIFFRKAEFLMDLLFLLGESIVLALAIYARILSQKVEIRKIEKPEKPPQSA